MTNHDVRVAINSDDDIVMARQKGRELAAQLGFSGSELTLIATAISEVARNILQYAGSGEMSFASTSDGEPLGIVIVAHDHGPGISDIERVMQIGYSTSESLGLGLPGARRLVDDMSIESAPGIGTKVIMKKWR